MSNEPYWENRTQEQYLNSLNIFFKKIKDRMPKYIVSNNNYSHDYLFNIYNDLDTLKNNLYEINKARFEEVFQIGIESIIKDIEENSDKDLYYIMLPTLHELIETKYNFKFIIDELIQNGEYSNDNIFDNSSYDWEIKAKEELNKMYFNLNLKSVQVNNNSKWEDIYKWASTTYQAILESQENIGLEPFHAGLNQTVNLSFNPESLKQTKGNGKMFAHDAVNTMVLNHFDKRIQKVIWQHEYAHILDNQAGVKLMKELAENKNEKIHPCTFLSQIEIERQLKEDNIKWSSTNEMYNAQVWMIESISNVVCGSSSDSLKEYNRKCSEEFSKKLMENFNIQFLGEQNWLLMNENTKNNLLNNQMVIEYVNYIVEEIYEKGVNSFFTKHWDNNDKVNKFNNSIYSIKEIIGDDNLFDNSMINFKEKVTQMSWDFFNIMKKHGYSHTNKQRYFPKSKTVVAAAQYSLNYISLYHTKILEIFARSCEDLQRPLIVSTKQYFDEKESSLINTEDFMNPQLNKNERKVFLNTVHALIKALGMQVNKEVEFLPALQETVINYAQTTYSSLSENEENAHLILNNAKQKTNRLN